MSLAPWFPPDFGLRKTSTGEIDGDGIGLTQNGRGSLLALALPLVVDSPATDAARWPAAARRRRFLFGLFFRLDLKLPFLEK